MQCERQAGGTRVDAQGACPASTCVYASGINNGIYAGRSCWAIAGTLCHNSSQPDVAEKQNICRDCTVYKQVSVVEEDPFLDTDAMIEQLSGYELF